MSARDGTCKHCGKPIRSYNADFTNGWTHEDETVGVWCRLTMADEILAERPCDCEDPENEYSYTQQCADAWQVVVGHPLIGPISSLPERSRYSEQVRARLDEISAERDASLAAIERVRDLHKQGQVWCSECDELIPCSTIRALDGGDRR